MVAVGEDLILTRQVGPSGIDQIQAGQSILGRNFLRSQMLFDGQRIIAAALHRRVVADDDTGAARNLTDPGNHPRCRNILAVHIVRGNLGDFQKGAARVKQPFDPLPWQQLAARYMAVARCGGSATGNFGG